MTRVVLFDVDGVLVHGYHSRPELQLRWDENLLADLGIDPEAFKDRFIYDVFVKKVLVGKIGLVEALDRVLPQLGYKGPTQRIVSYWLEHDSRLNVELIDVARRLKAAGVKLYIATNQEHLRADYLMQQVGLGAHVDGIIYSAALGYRKPDAQFFERAAAVAGAAPEDIVLVDDTLANVEAARRNGWHAVHWTGERLLDTELARYLG